MCQNVTNQRPGMRRVGDLLLAAEQVLVAFRHSWVSLLSIVLGLFVIAGLSQTNDSLLDSTATFWSWILLFLMTSAFWSLPVYRGARISLTTFPKVPLASPADKVAKILRLWFPVALGACPFIVFLAAILGARSRLEPTAALPEVAQASDALFAAAVIGSFFLGSYFLAVAVYWSKHTDGQEFGETLFPIQRRIGLPFLIILLIVLCFPLWFSDTFSRTKQLPLFLGAWVPTAAYIIEKTRRRRYLFVIVFATVLAMLWGLQDGFNDVRTLAREKLPPPQQDTRQTDINQAIARWRAANGCESPIPCKPAVLIAAEGGGSRAAFVASTVVGALLDATRSNPAAYRDFGTAIFVISGVSGGAVAAGSIRTALLDASSDNQAPCKEPDRLWFGATNDPPTKTWRNCLQMLVSGDYLTPTFAGFAFRDWFPTPFHHDRSVLLERALARHYSSILGQDWTTCEQTEDGLCARFGYAGENTTLAWVPLLILGSTSVETGRPVLFTDLRRTSASGVWKLMRSAPIMGPPDLFSDAYDVYELLASHRPGIDAISGVPITQAGVPPGITAAPDVRIATAMAASARFPFMTPSGALRNIDGKVVTRLVDGGYYDNGGLNALQRIVSELQNAGITPIVLHISNQPVPALPVLLQIPDTGGRYAISIVEPPQGFWSRLLKLTTAPLLTLNNARAGHSLRSQRDMEEKLATSGLRNNYVRVMVKERPEFSGEHGSWCALVPAQPVQMSDVTLSWWLSPILQHFLDLQLCDRQNDAAIRGLLGFLRR